MRSPEYCLSKARLEGGVGAVFERFAVGLVFLALGVADEEVVVHADHRTVARAFGDQRQAEADDTAFLDRHGRALCDEAGVIGEARLLLGRDHVGASVAER
jgi:hypothetical protein